MHRPLRLFLGVVLAVASVTCVSSEGKDPIISGAIGTWEVNTAESKYNPGPAPVSEVRTYEVAGEGVKFTAKGMDTEGRPTTLVQYTASYDGRDYPITGSRDWDTLAMKQVDAHTMETTLKRGGKEVATATRAISLDGETMTVRTRGTNASGQVINNIVVLKKR